MKYWDIKPQPPARTYEDWQFWLNRMQSSLMGLSLIPRIKIVKEPNDEDWEFVFVDAGNGKKQMAVF